MRIEFQNCELTIGHIGTPDEIAIQIIQEIADAWCSAMVQLADSLRPFVERMNDYAMKIAQDICRALEEAMRVRGI